MTTRHILSNATRLLVAAACTLATASCGSEMLRTGRAPVYLVVTQITASPGGDATGNFAFLNSDVALIDGSVENDSVTVSLRVEPKNPAVATTAMNAVTMTRYRVNFVRSDGRNTPGTDVPFGIEGALGATIPAGATVGVSFDVVRHQMKLEPPLKNLAGFDASGSRSISGLGFLSTIAEITLWGRDQNGNEVTATTSIDVHFANFGDL